MAQQLDPSDATSGDHIDTSLADIDTAMKCLDENGLVVVRGVTIDLAFVERGLEDWVPCYSSSFGHMLRTGMNLGLLFPWSCRKYVRATASAFEIIPGDRLYVHSVVTGDCGNELDVTIDQQYKLLRIGIQRGDQNIIPDGVIRLRQRGSLSTTYHGSYAIALQRLRTIVGATIADFRHDRHDEDIYEAIKYDEAYFEARENRPDERTEREWDQALQAHEAAKEAEYCRCFLPQMVDYAREGRIASLQKIDTMLDAATALGYWLAKAESAPVCRQNNWDS